MEPDLKDFSQIEADLEVSDWHKELLDERAALIARGEAKFIDWETAKKQIQDAVYLS
jgi:hypothetical protein